MKRLIVYIAIVLLNSVSGYAVDNLTLLWKKTQTVPDGKEIDASILRFDARKSQIVLLTGAHDKQDMSKKQSSLVQYDISGNTVSQSYLSRGEPNENNSGINIDSEMIPVSNDRYLVSGEGGRESFDCVSKSENKKSALTPQSQVKDIRIRKMLDLPDECILLIGEDGKGTARLTKISQESVVVWEKQYDLEQYEYFCDGVVARDSSLFIVGCSFRLEGFFPIPETSKIWLLHLDSNGNIIKDKFIEGDTFPMMSPKICDINSDSVILFYDKEPVLNKVELVIRILSYSLEDKEGKMRSLMTDTVPRKFFMAKSSKTKDGAAVVLHNQGGFELYQIDGKGDTTASVIVAGRFLDVGSFVCADDKAFISAVDMSKRNEIYLYAAQLK